MAYSVRPLAQADWEVFRSIRLEALKDSPQFFGSNFVRENAFTQTDWHERLSGDGKAMFGLFDENQIIGLTGIVTDQNDQSQKTALIISSYTTPVYRGKGLSRMLYQACISWAKDQPQIKRITVSHRESNLASKHANQKFGFVEIGRSSKTWPDGTSEDEIFYELTV